jgi:UDP-N-acetylglucosamine--N-acetylmuramyl-(pentapeptide) pyrophosphoryl-undecaprenol N-acetylglucosamine transferase
MTPATPAKPSIAIACGGTGGHLFPGLAVADRLVRRGCEVTLLISPKDVDQQAVKQAAGLEVITLPAVGLTGGRRIAFLQGFIRSYRAARQRFRLHPPQAALAMGGFTSAPPILAAKRLGARTFLHESNTIPGRANRWISWVVDQAFVGFPQAGTLLHNRIVTVTGTPVREQLRVREPAACRVALGLDPARPVLLVMGGSQGASGINDLVVRALPCLVKHAPQIQLLHLTGPHDAEKVRQACAANKLKAVVHPFCAEMELVLGAATAAISRAGASSLAELAALRLPTLLIPYPAATDNHQFFNARAFAENGAARLLEQKNAAPEALAWQALELVESATARQKMQAALAKWHAPRAAEQIAELIVTAVARSASRQARPSSAAVTAPGSNAPEASTARPAPGDGRTPPNSFGGPHSDDDRRHSCSAA